MSRHSTLAARVPATAADLRSFLNGPDNNFGLLDADTSVQVLSLNVLRRVPDPENVNAIQDPAHEPLCLRCRQILCDDLGSHTEIILRLSGVPRPQARSFLRPYVGLSSWVHLLPSAPAAPFKTFGLAASPCDAIFERVFLTGLSVCWEPDTSAPIFPRRDCFLRPIILWSSDPRQGHRRR